MRNGTETDVDCGGPTCGACGTNASCSVGTDCTSGVCDATGHCAAPTLVFTAVTPTAATPPIALGTIPGVPGRRVRIIKLGICGDADATSGQQGFRASDGAGMSFTWGAGQNNSGNVTYVLAPTPVVTGSARGFSYQTVDILAASGASVAIEFALRFDFDALFCGASDENGTAFADAASTTRAWVKYRYE